MKRQLKYASILLAAMVLIPGIASAGQDEDDFSMTLNVEAHCEFYVAQHNMDIDTTGMTADIRSFIPFWRMTGIAQSNSVWVKCNAGLPYQLELDTEAGGQTILTDHAAGRALPFLVKWGEVGSNGALWGQVANGEQFSGIGTGVLVNTVFHAASNWQVGWNPADGYYERMMTANLIF